MIQYHQDGRRYYYKDGLWYISVTEFIKNALPTPPHLIKWYKENTAQFIDDTLERTSRYGTLFHDHMETFAHQGYLEMDNMDGRLGTHLAAGAQFFADYEIKPLMIEERVAHDDDGTFPLNFAGTLDLFAEITYNGERRFAYIDYKTGNIQDYHKYQMMCYHLGYKNMHEDIEDPLFINMRPKDWRKSPTYEVKVWKLTMHDWDVLQAMMKIFSFEPPKDIRTFTTIEVGKPPIINTITPEQWIQNQQTNEIDFVL